MEVRVLIDGRGNRALVCTVVRLCGASEMGSEMQNGVAR